MGSMATNDCVHTSRLHFQELGCKGVFTLTETKTDTETDKMGLKHFDIGHSICLGQYEHLHTIPYNQFFIRLGLWTHPKDQSKAHTLRVNGLAESIWYLNEGFVGHPHTVMQPFP